jgi:hypothetical protein
MLSGRDSGLVVCYRIKLVLKRPHRWLVIGRLMRRGSFRGGATCGTRYVDGPHWMVTRGKELKASSLIVSV